MADRYKDDFIEKDGSTDSDKAFLKGQLMVLDDLVGLPAFIKSFRDPKLEPQK